MAKQLATHVTPVLSRQLCSHCITLLLTLVPVISPCVAIELHYSGPLGGQKGLQGGSEIQVTGWVELGHECSRERLRVATSRLDRGNPHDATNAAIQSVHPNSQPFRATLMRTALRKGMAGCRLV